MRGDEIDWKEIQTRVDEMAERALGYLEITTYLPLW